MTVSRSCVGRRRLPPVVGLSNRSIIICWITILSSIFMTGLVQQWILFRNNNGTSRSNLVFLPQDENGNIIVGIPKPHGCVPPVAEGSAELESFLAQSTHNLRHHTYYNNSTNKKPLFIMHVGSGKTGTTALQKMLTDLQPQLKNDGYSYHGKFIEREFEDASFSPILKPLVSKECYKQVQQARERRQVVAVDGVDEEVECWKSFYKELNRLYTVGRNVILSEEWEILVDIPSFQQALMEDWDVRIVISYRRLWEWLPSVWSQEIRAERLTTQESSNGGVQSLPFFIQDTFVGGPGGTWRPWRKAHDAEGLLSTYQPHLPVIVLNTHEKNNNTNPNDIASIFLCNVLPDAKSACQTSRRNPEDVVRLNQSPNNMHYVTIAKAAASRGFFDKETLRRARVTCRMTNQSTTSKADELPRRCPIESRIEDYHQKELGSSPLPMDCLDQKGLEYLLEESKRIEAMVDPAFYSLHQATFEQEFRSAVAKNRFCSVNTTAILEDPNWTNFLSNLTLPDPYHLDYVLVSVFSMERSGSTTLVRAFRESHPCAISLTEVWNQDIKSAGDAWAIEGNWMLQEYKKGEIPPYYLVEFLLALIKRRCRRFTNAEQCDHTCAVVYKQFREHLSPWQYLGVWQLLPLPTLPVVLERNLEDRWKSKWVAVKNADWDTEGSAEHKEKIRQTKIPPLSYSNSSELCQLEAESDTMWHTCRFEELHNQWFSQVRGYFPTEERVEVSFSETITEGGRPALDKIVKALPHDFHKWWFATLHKK